MRVLGGRSRGRSLRGSLVGLLVALVVGIGAVSATVTLARHSGRTLPCGSVSVVYEGGPPVKVQTAVDQALKGTGRTAHPAGGLGVTAALTVDWVPGGSGSGPVTVSHGLGTVVTVDSTAPDVTAQLASALSTQAVAPSCAQGATQRGPSAAEAPARPVRWLVPLLAALALWWAAAGPWMWRLPTRAVRSFRGRGDAEGGAGEDEGVGETTVGAEAS